MNYPVQDRNITHRVCIFQRGVVDYRVAFYNVLDKLLKERGVDLSVVAEHLPPGSLLVDGLDKVQCGVKVRNLRFGRRAYWQTQIWPFVKTSDMIIIPQENCFLNTYPILLRRQFVSTPKVALWGHGATLRQVRWKSFSNKLKEIMSRHVDWWFAYTDFSAQIVRKIGFPRDKIAVVQNAIDVKRLRQEREKISELELASIRNGLFHDDHCARTPDATTKTGVFCGRLIPSKWIPFLLESIKLIHDSLPNFRMIVIGTGPERSLVDAFCKENSWCAAVGARHGVSHVKFLALGDILLNPGSIGLAVLDAFSLGIPVATTDNRIHCPEISYLKDGHNGIVTKPDIHSFSQSVVSVLVNQQLLQVFQDHAEQDSGKYTIENMAYNFEQGILRCLNMDK